MAPKDSRPDIRTSSDDARTTAGMLSLNNLTSKRKAIIAFLAMGGLLSFVFAFLGSFHEVYIVVLVSVTGALIVGALPDVKLGLTAGFLFLQPLFFYIGNTSFNQSKLPFTIIFISFLIFLWLGEKAVRGSGEIRLTDLIWPGLFVLASAVLSLINAVGVLIDFQHIIWMLYLGIFLIYIANTLKTPEQIRYLLYALMSAAFLASIYALSQYFGLLASAFPDKLEGTSAISSSFGNRNFLGGYLAYLLPVGLFLLFTAKSQISRYLLVLPLALFMITLLAIDSDSAWLAMILSSLALLAGLWMTGELAKVKVHWALSLTLVVTTLFLAVVLMASTAAWIEIEDLSNPSFGDVISTFTPLAWVGIGLFALFPVVAVLYSLIKTQHRRWVTWGTPVFAALLVLILVLTPSGDRVLDTLSGIRESESAVAREQLWWTAWEMFKDQPLVGIGVGDFKREYLIYKSQFLSSERGQEFLANGADGVVAEHAHNDFLQIAAETGIVGILALLALLGIIAGSIVRSLRQKEASSNKWLIVGLASGVVAVLGDAIFSFPLYLPTSLLILIFFFGALQSRALSSSGFTVVLSKGALYFITTLVIIFLGTTSFFAFRSWQADLHLQRALVAMPVGNPIAEGELLESLRIDPLPAETIYQLGKWYFQQGDFIKAKQFLERSLPLHGREDAYYFLAIIHSQSGDLQRALNYLDSLLSFNPASELRDELGPHLQALLLHATGSSDRAIGILEGLIERQFKIELIHLDLADVYIAQGDNAEARAHLVLSLEKIDEILTSNLDEDGEPLPNWRINELQQLRRGADELLRLLP